MFEIPIYLEGLNLIGDKGARLTKILFFLNHIVLETTGQKEEIRVEFHNYRIGEATTSQALKRINNNNYLRRRWLDFRNGHSIYLVFLMTFANFVTIQYQLLLQRVPIFHSLNISIWDFAIIFVLAYVPLGMIIGYWHRKNQFSVEAEALFSQNQIGATINLFLIDLIDGKVTEEEKQQMRSYLLKIMKRSDRSKLYKEAASSDPRLDAESKVNLQKTE